MDESAERILAEFTDAAVAFMDSNEDLGCDLENLTPNCAPIARLLELIVQEMHTLRADRAVITPIDNVALVEFEIGGKMLERDSLPMRVYLALATRIEIYSKEADGLGGFRVRSDESDRGKRIEML
jgi:type IV pilus assembly protein PilB